MATNPNGPYRPTREIGQTRLGKIQAAHPTAVVIYVPSFEGGTYEILPIAGGARAFDPSDDPSRP